MREAVEERRDAGGVGEDGIPFLEGLMGGQDDGVAFIAVVDDLEEQVGGVSVVGEVADFVEDEQGGASLEAELAAASGGGIEVEFGDQVRDGAEQDGVAGQDGGMGNVLGDHRLAHTIAAAQDQVRT